MLIDADIGFDLLDIVSMVVADRDIVCGLYPKRKIHWKRVAQAVRDGVPPEELHQHAGSSWSNLVTGPAGNGDSRTLTDRSTIGAGETGFMLIKRGVFGALG